MLKEIHDCDEVSISYNPESRLFDIWLHNKALMLLLDDNEMMHLLGVLLKNAHKIRDVISEPEPDDKEELAKV